MTRPLTAPGRLVAGRYRLQSQLGGGGMGTVWLARDELLGRMVAIKQVLTTAGASAEEADQQRQRALREGRIAARLSHPHAISVYDVALEGGQPWLVMEYLPSRSLAAVLNEDGSLRVDQSAQVGAQVADALAATHAAGIVHRDVKPANILIGEGGRVEGLVKITDFGISHASGDVTLTQTGQITGTPAFLAPEVAQGHPMTEASDVFSLGATLYTCVEGQPPFGMEDNALAMLHKVAGAQILPPHRAGSLTQPLTRMLAADPADRPTMPEVRDELAKLAAGRGGNTTTVLLARTDIGAASPGRNRTAAFPAEAAATPTPTPPPTPAPLPPPPTRTDTRERGATAEPAAAAVAAPAAAAVAVDPEPTPVRAPREPGRRRGKALWLLIGLVTAALAGLIVFWVVALGNDPADSAASDSSADATQSSAASSDTAQPTESDSSNTAEESTPATSAAPAAGDPASAASAFFADIPGNLEAAYQLTSPEFQANHSFADFSGFWDDFSSVQIANVRTEGDTTALLDITYVRPDGSSETEPHRMRFVQGQDDRLLLLDDVIAE
jgi:hypothetical protein